VSIIPERWFTVDYAKSWVTIESAGFGWTRPDSCWSHSGHTDL